MFSTRNSFFFCGMCLITIISLAKLQTCPDVPKLRILPGFGWDALTNKDMKQLMKWTYNQCQLTSDGKLMIPDNTIAVRQEIQEKQIEAEIFDHWSNYTELSSAGFKLATDIWPEEFLSLYYSFTDEYQEIKNIQVKNETFTCRSQIRQVIYRVNSTSKAQLGEAVKERVQQVMTALVKNDTAEATYRTEMIVNDYGTHYTTNIDVGTVIVMEEYLKNEFLDKHSNDKSKILSASKLSLLEFIISTGFSLEDQHHNLDSSLVSEYKKATLKRKIRVSSGLNWKKYAISERMVTIDRSGDVLPSLVTSANFPDASPAMLTNVRQMFGDVIRNYYSRNIYRGCTRPKSSNFDFVANLDDGSCKSTVSEYKFGGAYATFNRNVYQVGDNGYPKKNPLTGGLSCPTNFQSQVFYTFLHCQSNSNVWSLISCVARANGSVEPSYLFGGLYSNEVDNIHTKNKSCPQFYTALPLPVAGWTFCYSSTDNKLAKQHALHFGGFATVDTDFQCPTGYKKHFASPIGVVVRTHLKNFNYGKVYYCLREQNVKNLGIVPSLLRFPFSNV